MVAGQPASHGCNRGFALELMRVIPFRRVRKTNKASLRVRDRYRYFTREFAAAACQKTSIAPGSKKRRCADDHHRPLHLALWVAVLPISTLRRGQVETIIVVPASSTTPQPLSLSFD